MKAEMWPGSPEDLGSVLRTNNGFSVVERLQTPGSCPVPPGTKVADTSSEGQGLGGGGSEHGKTTAQFEVYPRTYCEELETSRSLAGTQTRVPPNEYSSETLVRTSESAKECAATSTRL
jgi:hypothetical protein